MRQLRRADMEALERVLQSVAVPVFLTLILLAGIEVSARIWYHFWESKDPLVIETNNLPKRQSLNARYESEDFDAWKADSASLPSGLLKFRWHPYVYWRRPAIDLQTMHVSDDGIRKTVQPFGKEAGTQIMMFGGSTMWGTGVRDEHSIPSLVAKRLSELGFQDFYVTNFGESAYGSTQSLLSLILQLRSDNVPDVAIFYEGVNEIASSQIRQKAGETQHEGTIGLSINDPRRVEQMSVLEIVAMKSAAVKGALNLIGKLKGRKMVSGDSGAANKSADPQELADATIRNYAAVLELAQALAEHYGFQAYFFWQPSVFSKLHRTAVEQRFVDESDNDNVKSLPDLVARVNGGIRNHPPKVKHFVDLQAAFDAEERNLYVDIFHPTENGNAIIARNIAETVARTGMHSRAGNSR